MNSQFKQRMSLEEFQAQAAKGGLSVVGIEKAKQEQETLPFPATAENETVSADYPAIEKGVPFPKKKRHRWGAYVETMECGDSAVLPNRALAHSLGLALKTAGFHWAVSEEAPGKFRVWKAEPLTAAERKEHARKLDKPKKPRVPKITRY